MYKIDKEIKTKLTEKEIKKKLYNISSKKRRSSIFFIPNQEKFFIKEMEDSIVLYTIPYYKNRGFVPKIKIKMYSNGENTIMTMRYSLYFEAELIIIITNILELKYLDYLGIKPVLDSCAVCGRPSAITVSTSKGGFVCANCHTNEKIVDKKTINVLRKLYHVDISKISKIKLSNNTRKEIDDFINEYYDRYSGLYLKSKNFLKSIKNVYI